MTSGSHISVALVGFLALAFGLVPHSRAERQTAAMENRRQPAAAPPRSEGPAGTWFRLIPEGRFLMGCVSTDSSCDPDHPNYRQNTWTRARESELPNHPVRLEAFYLAETETTNSQYSMCVGAGACRPLPDDPAEANPEALDHPAVGLSWEDARAFCGWIGGRLPTEAEWEYAARGGLDSTIYPTGQRLTRDHANYGALKCCSGWVEGRDRWKGTAPVGSFPPNSFGLYDMAGNVWELVSDWHSADAYVWSPGSSPTGPATGDHRTVRGGSWLTAPDTLRSSNRGRLEPTGRDESRDHGFRCARDLPAAPDLGSRAPRSDPFQPATCALAFLARAAQSATQSLELARLEAACRGERDPRGQFLLESELDVRDVLFQAPRDDGPFRRSLLRLLAEIQVDRGEYVAAVKLRELVFESSSASDDRARLADTHLLIAERAVARGDLAAAREPYEKAIGHLEELGDPSKLARAYASLAATRGVVRDTDEEQALLERAVELDPECGDCRDHLARFLIDRGTRSVESAVSEARSYFERALAADPSPAVRAMANYGLGLTFWDDAGRALGYLEPGKGSYGACDECRENLAILSLNRAVDVLDQADWTEGRRLCAQALATARSKSTEARAHVYLAGIESLSGDLTRAENHLRSALRAAPDCGVCGELLRQLLDERALQWTWKELSDWNPERLGGG